MVALSSKEKIDVIDLETGQLKKTLLLPKPNFSNGRVNIVCFSPDDKLLLTAYAQGDFSDPYGTLSILERESLIITLEYCHVGTFTGSILKRLENDTRCGGDQFFIWDTQTGSTG
jgi:WD40 repeat protein